MTIQKYEDWMRPQVVAMFDQEYGTVNGAFDQLFGRFYEHDFQSGKCIRIVAVEGEIVAGFQSFFYWPVVHNGTTVNSYQSGNSLVHPDQRGKGLFARMLNFIDDPVNGFSTDLLIGFPVEASFNSFIRNQWMNPFDLQWFVKPLDPVRSMLTSPVSKLNQVLPNRDPASFSTDVRITHVAQLAEMDTYRFSYEQGDFYRYIFEEDGNKAFFEMKAQVRKKIIKELVIGKFLVTDCNKDFAAKALAALIKTVRSRAHFAMVSIAVNPKSSELTYALQANGFGKIDRSIHFIAKGKLATEIKDWSNWWMFRSDIDTW